jgi:TolA-binding protein
MKQLPAVARAATTILVAVALFAPAFVAVPHVGAQETAAAKSSPEAVQVYRDAASFQNNKAFDLAVEEWQKFLKQFPKDPLAAKAQHYLGVCQLSQKHYEPAAAAFEAVIKNHPKFELLEDAYLNLALSQYALAGAGTAGMHAKAAETFQTLETEFPKGKYVAEALFYQGESLYAMGKKPEAIAAYSKLVEQFGKSPRRTDALYALGATQEELNQFAEAGATYDKFLKEFPGDSRANEVKMRKGETLLQAGDFAGAEKLLAEVAAIKGFAQADYAIFRQAVAVAKQDKFAAAGALFAKIPQDYKDSAFAADATIAAARCFYQAEKFAEAKQWLQKAIDAKNANSPEAAHWLCKILLREKLPEAAAKLAAAQAQSAGDSPFAVNLLLDQADALFDIPSQRAEALPLYLKLAADHPKSDLAPQSLYNAAFTALDLKQYDAALKHAGAFLQTYPKDKLLPDAKYVAAESDLLLKNYSAAESAYRDLIEGFPQHADINNWRVRLGLVLYLQKNYAETIAALTPVIANLKSPDAVAEAQFLIGASQFNTDKFKEAEKSLAASLAADSKWRQADETLLLLARAQMKLGQDKAAVATIQKLIAEFPQSALLDQAHYRLGEFQYAAEDYKSAAAQYGLVAKNWPDSPFAPYALYGQGWAALKTKEFPAATASFTALLDKHADSTLAADAHFGRAMSRRQEGALQEAVDDIAAYLKSNPDSEHQSEALYERGLAEVALKKYSDAIATFKSLLSDNPKYAAGDKVLYETGWAYKSEGKDAEAVPSFAQLAKDYPDSPLAVEANFHVAEQQYDSKDYAAAAKLYAAVLAKAPVGELREKAAYKLGWSDYQRQAYDEALKAFTAQIAAYPQGALAADGTFMKAECLFRQQNFPEAFPAYEAAAKTKASSPTIEALILLHGGQSAAQLKQWDASLAMLTQLPTKFPESPFVAEAFYEAGWAQQNLAQPAEALKSYEEAANRSRDHVGARARFMMGEIEFEQKKFDEAIREFQRAMFGFGGDSAMPETKNWQAKSGYEAGRCAEVQIASDKDAAAKAKHLADAKKFYEFVVTKHPQHELAAEAKKRLDALAKL